MSTRTPTPPHGAALILSRDSLIAAAAAYEALGGDWFATLDAPEARDAAPDYPAEIRTILDAAIVKGDLHLFEMVAIRDAVRKHAQPVALLVTEPELVAAIRKECARLLIRFPNEQMLDRTWRFRPVHDGHWSRLTQSQKDDARASRNSACALAKRVGEDLGALLAGLRDIPSPGGVDPGVPLADAAD